MTRTLVVALVLLGACKKQMAPAPPASAISVSPSAASLPLEQAVDRMVENFARVHFAFDSAALNEVSKDALAANVRIMQSHPRIRVEIQGHADERGTTDYNVALGDRRARAVMNHMALLGVTPSRVVTVSYGEEVPLDGARGEAAWSKNRRAEFRILIGEDGVAGTVD